MKTIRELELGETTIRLVEMKTGFGGVIISKNGQSSRFEGDNPDALWEELKKEAGKSNESYFGFDGARKRFTGMFPDGFGSTAFTSHERAYKAKASDYLREALPLAEAIDSCNAGEVALKAFRQTNLLAPIEQARVQDLLRGKFADSFIRGAACFASGNISEGIAQMKLAATNADIAKWTVLTYLPFLWLPREHMFLKPAVTKDFASRVGHSFAHDYSPTLDPRVYESLLRLAAETKLEVSRFEPADNIDIQSFIWIVGKYDAADEAEVIRKREG